MARRARPHSRQAVQEPGARSPAYFSADEVACYFASQELVIVKPPCAEVAFLIRPYRPADFDRLWQVDQTCFPPGIAYTQMDLTGFITRRNAITLVAEFD